jgi:thiamine biosynthesis lipoprotein ApbE
VAAINQAAGRNAVEVSEDTLYYIQKAQEIDRPHRRRVLIRAWDLLVKLWMI